MGTAIGELLEKEEIELEFLSEKKVGVDAFNTLYQFLSIIRGQDGSPLMDSEGNVTSHFAGLFYRTTNLIKLGIKPVFVFDGKPHKLKSKTREERQRIRTEAEKKFREAQKKGDKEKARKFAQQAVKLDEKIINESKELVQLMGLPVVQAPSEGEAQIAGMAREGKLYGCVSQDYDALLFGTPVLLRNIAVGGKRKAPGKNYYYEVKPERIFLEENLKKLGITREKLIWIGVLIGTDFNQKFPRIGPKTALELVKKFDSFEKIEKETSHTPSFDFREIEEIFLKPSYSKEFSLNFNPPQNEKIIEFLCEQHSFSKERVQNTLAKLEEVLSAKGEQSTLDKWF